MAYICEWFNRLDQFGFVNIDLTVTDNSGIIPTTRHSKNWRMDDNDVNLQFLEDQAVIIVDRIIDEWNILNT